MKQFNYLMILAALLMMNVMNAELKTFGMPTETEEAPTEEVPDEEAPDEEAPDEEAPDEEAPDEEEEMPSASEDSEVSTDQPIKFKEEFLVSANLGTTMPLGKNISPEFSSGLSFGLSVKTPFSFKLGNNDIDILLKFDLTTLGANEVPSTDVKDFGISTFGAALGTKISVLDVHLNLGMASLSGTALDSYDENGVFTADDFSNTSPFIGMNIAWQLPIPTLHPSLEDLRVSLLAGGAMVMSGPTNESASSEILNFGLSIGYPFLF